VILPISTRLLAQISGRSQLSNLAISLLETCGFPAMVGAMDSMLKAAEVYVSGYEKTGSGLCTAIIRGNISNVTFAVDAEMSTAELIGELRSVMVIPRPLENLEMTLPTASCWIEKPSVLPLQMPQNELADTGVPVLRDQPLVDLEMRQSTLDKLPALLDEEPNY
jgi:carbon dioxide concentrating mechanism protein CcmO